jgi:hypothetical protein
MSMILTLTSVGDGTFELLRRHPRLVWELVSGEPFDPPTPEPHGSRRAGVFSRWFGSLGRGRTRSVEPELVRLPELADGEGETCDLDKSWHGVHWVLTGSAWAGEPPLDFLVRGGVDLGKEEVGYAIPRGFSAAEVRRIDVEMSAVEADVVASRFDGPAMEAAELYPGSWEDPQADMAGYVLDNLARLRSFVRTTHERSLGLVVALT